MENKNCRLEQLCQHQTSPFRLKGKSVVVLPKKMATREDQSETYGPSGYPLIFSINIIQRSRPRNGKIILIVMCVLPPQQEEEEQ
jgi:hypothetical protein